MNIRRLTFLTALRLLLHPASLAAMGLLLLNDWLLRRLWPSWWTGKLGDAAWLFFAPIVLALGLAWVVPAVKEPRRHTRVTLELAFLLTGVAFSLVKTFPAANALATRIAAALLGAPPALTLDPSDLLALPALVLAALFCRRATRPAQAAAAPLAASTSTPVPHALPAVSPRAGSPAPSRLRIPAAQSPRAGLPRATFSPADRAAPPRAASPLSSARRTAAWWVIPLAAAILLADAAAPDPGIGCLALQPAGQITAAAGYDRFVSADGGLTWERGQPGGAQDCRSHLSPTAGDGADWQVVEAPQPGTSFRYRPGEEIQVSTGGGAWQTAFRPASLSEAGRIYTLRSRPGNPVDRPGPLDALADPASGNVLFAMGQQGVLVRTPQGQWVWSAAGAYRRLEQFPTADAFALLLGGMALLALGLFLWIYAALAIRWLPKPASPTPSRVAPTLRGVVLALAALAWLGVDILFPPATSAGYDSTITALGMLAFAILVLPLAIELTFRLARRAPHLLPRLAGIALAGAIGYFFPYLLWLYSTLPGFQWATLLGLAFALAALGAGWFAPRGKERA